MGKIHCGDDRDFLADMVQKLTERGLVYEVKWTGSEHVIEVTGY